VLASTTAGTGQPAKYVPDNLRSYRLCELDLWTYTQYRNHVVFRVVEDECFAIWRPLVTLSTLLRCNPSSVTFFCLILTPLRSVCKIKFA